jgi:hypothetical protein
MYSVWRVAGIQGLLPDHSGAAGVERLFDLTAHVEPRD